MFVMTYSQARQNFSSFLDQAKKDGVALIKRSDGSQFKVIPVLNEEKNDSPFAKLAGYSSNVNSKLSEISLQEMIDMLHEAQDERADQIIAAASRKKPEDFFNLLKKAGV